MGEGQAEAAAGVRAKHGGTGVRQPVSDRRLGTARLGWVVAWPGWLGRPSRGRSSFFNKNNVKKKIKKTLNK